MPLLSSSSFAHKKKTLHFPSLISPSLHPNFPLFLLSIEKWKLKRILFSSLTKEKAFEKEKEFYFFFHLEEEKRGKKEEKRENENSEEIVEK